VKKELKALNSNSTALTNMAARLDQLVKIQ